MSALNEDVNNELQLTIAVTGLVTYKQVVPAEDQHRVPVKE